MKLRVLLILTLLGLSNSFLSSQNWVKLNGPVGAEIQSAIITKKNSEIYAASSSGLIFFSSNKGISWLNINSGLPKPIKNPSVIIKESPLGTIYLSYDKLLYYLDKSLFQWIQIGDKNEYENFDFSPDGKIYAGTKAAFYISTDGIKFNFIKSWWTTSIEFLCLGNNNNFIRMTNDNAGDIWSFNDDGSGFMHLTTNSCCGKFLYVKKTKNLFYIDNAIIQSDDFGINWTSLSSNKPRSYLEKIAQLNDGTLIMFADLVYSSYDGGYNWNVDHNYAKYVYSSYEANITISDKDEILICDYSSANLLTQNNPSLHLVMPIIQPHIFKVAQFGDQYIYTSNIRNAQFSDDNGKNWKFRTNIYPELFWKDGTTGEFISNELKISNDFFQTAIKKNLPLNSTFTQCYLDNNENIILRSFDNTYISYNKGDSWDLLGINPVSPSQYIRSKISKKNIIFGNKNDSIYYSFNHGLNWEKFYAERLDDNFPIYLSNNNIFIWRIKDFTNLSYDYYYSPDFGKSKYLIPDISKEDVRYIDDYNNIYCQKGYFLEIYNVLDQTTLKLDIKSIYDNQPSIGRINSVLRGNNDYIYATFYQSPIYMYDLKLITNIKNSVKNKIVNLQSIPNPSDHWTNIELPDHLKHKNIIVKLSNSTGSELRNYKFNGNRIRIEKNELVSGVYFLTIYDKDGMKAYSKIVFE